MRDKASLSMLGMAALLAAFGCLSARAQSPTITVSPASITNDYVGKIVLTISNLTAGQTVMVQKYADVNANGVVDLAQDWLVQAFKVTDGKLPLLGGVRNINIPGDDDGATNGQLRVELNFPSFNPVLERIAGHYLFQVVDPLGVFAPATASFAVLQKPYPQGVSGTVLAAGTGLPLTNAAVVLVVQQGNGGMGTFTDASGHFAISNATGDFALIAFKNGFVADQSTAGLTLSSNTFVTKNLTNLVATQALSGKLSDSSSGKGLPAMFVQAESTNNLMTISFTDTNGNFTLPAVPSQWKLKINEDAGLAQGGYVAFQNNSLSTNTSSGSVSNLNFQFPKGTALVYGHLVDNLSNAVPALSIQAQDGSYSYESRGITSVDGNYSVAVFGGDWSVGPSGEELVGAGFLGQASNFSITNGQALRQDFQLQRATAHLRGRVVDGNGSPVGNMGMVVFLTTNFGPSTVNLNVQTMGDGTFDVGVFAGTWSVGLECNSAADHGLVVPYISLSVVDGVDQNNLTLSAPFVTGYITGNIQDNHGNPVSVNVYATLTRNGTNYNACGGNGGSSFQLPVFNGSWSLGISGDVTSLGYDNPPNQTVNVSGGNVVVNITLYPLGQTPVRLGAARFLNGQFQFTLTGSSGRMYRLDATTNLSNPAAWVPVATNTAFGGTFMFMDNTPVAQRRFYRAVLAP